MIQYKHQLLVRMTEAEYEYLLSHSLAFELPVNAVLRKALRMLQVLETTPGAMDAVMQLHREHMGPLLERADPL